MDPLLPIDRIEPCEAIERIDPFERSDRIEVVAMTTSVIESAETGNHPIS
jgi:hypothetical protein